MLDKQVLNDTASVIRYIQSFPFQIHQYIFVFRFHLNPATFVQQFYPPPILLNLDIVNVHHPKPNN